MKSARLFLIITVMLLAVLCGCNMPTPKQTLTDPTPDLNQILTQIALEQPTASTPEMEQMEDPTALPTEEPTPTPAKIETLTVCLGKEPDTLFFYDESSQAMWSVLESIYDGPFDVGNGEVVPVIFDEITVTKEPVEVIRGDIIVDVDGNTAEMKPGTVFMPAELKEECSGLSCLSTWTAVSESAEMIQTVITYKLKEGLTWSDGTPLTAEDSVFSMSVNGMKGINASKRIYNLTESYTVLDETTVEWRGLPGYEPENVSEVFWIPLPKHVMKGMSAEMIRESELVTQKPLGWGAWQISSWEKGSQIVADRNPYYVSADGTLPYFDRIVYKFYGRAGDNNLEALHSGTCDIIDASVDLSVDLKDILEDTRDGKEAVYIQPELTRQEIVLNLSSTDAASQNILDNTDLRTAVAQCINRSSLIQDVLYGQSEIPVDFYPAAYAEHNESLEALPFDPEAAKETLETLGWTLDETNGGSTRIATQVSGVRYGSALSFVLSTSDSVAAGKAAARVRNDLAECGIDVEINPLPLGELYAQGPEGIIFGRSFDAAMFSWSAGTRSACSVYRSDQIPDNTNHWVGTNVGSYQSEDYDEACRLPELAENDARIIFAEELPSIPLYFNISIAVSDTHICGLEDKIASRSILWNLEQLSRSEDRCAVSQWNNIYQ